MADADPIKSINLFWSTQAYLVITFNRVYRTNIKLLAAFLAILLS